MKLLFSVLIFFSSAQAYAESVTLWVKDWYSQTYLEKSTLVPNREQKITIELNSNGIGEFLLPNRHYRFGRTPQLSNDTFIEQRIRAQSDATSCQLSFEMVLNVRYCSVKKLEEGKDCDVTGTVTKQDIFNCADLVTGRRESEALFEAWETLEGGDVSLQYAFANNIYARKLEVKR